MKLMPALIEDPSSYLNLFLNLGKQYTDELASPLDLPIEGPKGKALVRTGWIYDKGVDFPRLTSANPKKQL